MAYDVFLSYASEDKALADAACATLESRKIRCWIAPRDITPGMPYGEAIINAINQCKVLIVLLSEKTNDSPHVANELERAVHNRKAVIPVRIENVRPRGQLEYFLAGKHWLDALTPPLEAHLQKLADVVTQLIDLARSPESGKSAEQVGAASRPIGALPEADKAKHESAGALSLYDTVVRKAGDEARKLEGEREGPYLRIANKLGVETALSVEMSRQSNDLTSFIGLRGNGWASRVLLDREEGYTLSIPIKFLREATLTAGKHVLVFLSGRQLRGQLYGTILARPGSKSHDLRSVTRLVVEGSTAADPRLRQYSNQRAEVGSTSPKEIWELQIGQDDTLLVYEPEFWYEYYSNTYLTTGSETFFIKVGTESYQANISDFVKLSVDGTRVVVHAANGTTTSGTLQMTAEGTGGKWLLRAFLADNDGSGPDDEDEAIMVLTTRGSLNRKATAR